jgi:hypothetical protein
MELAADLTADVSYDMKVLAPDGEVYDNADLKELEARKGKTPTVSPFLIMEQA